MIVLEALAFFWRYYVSDDSSCICLFLSPSISAKTMSDDKFSYAWLSLLFNDNTRFEDNSHRMKTQLTAPLRETFLSSIEFSDTKDSPFPTNSFQVHDKGNHQGWHPLSIRHCNHSESSIDDTNWPHFQIGTFRKGFLGQCNLEWNSNEEWIYIIFIGKWWQSYRAPYLDYSSTQ